MSLNQIGKLGKDELTAIDNTVLQGCHELCSDACHVILLHFVGLTLLPQAFINVLLEVVSVDGVDDIAEPLPINMDPVFQLWNIFLELGHSFSILEKLLNGKTFYDWYS